MFRPQSRRSGSRRMRRATSWLRLEALESRQLLTIFTVSSIGDSGPNTLRQAIIDSDTMGATPTSPNTIKFDITATGVQKIALQTALPAVTVPTVIDGSTQPGAASGPPLIELDGSAITANADGLLLTAGNSTVRGLIIHGFKDNGIHIESAGSDTIAGNWIGVDSTGAAIALNGQNGILIDNVGQNVIGGTAQADRNVISGNTGFGVNIQGTAANANQVEGNFIGIDFNSTKGLPNTAGGVQILNAPNNTIGGNSTNQGNTISGNSQLGVLISGSTATHNVLEANFIGTSSTGVSAIPNVAGGVQISGAPSNTVGGTSANQSNTISGNTGFGISISDAGATGNLIVGNKIGTANNGIVGLGNTGDGIDISTSSNTIGGASTNAGNVIGKNIGSGIHLSNNAATNVIQGNFIGTNTAGVLNLGNGVDGIVVDSASTNTIGATATATGFVSGVANSIAFNGRNGVTILSGKSDVIRQNRIFSNVKLGIDLAPLGANQNHLPSVDTSAGANTLENSPLVATATSTTGVTTVQGKLFSTVNSTFELDFYSNTVLDPSGLGQGAVYIGSLAVTTDSIGLASYTFNPASPVALNSIITATATDASGNTSEFSPQALNLAPSSDLVISITGPTTVVPVGGFFVYTITVTNNGPSNATNATVTDTLPAGVTSNLNTSSQGSINQSGSLVTALLGTLNVGATATVTLNLTPTTAGALTNTASVSADQADPNQANDTVTSTTTVQTAADLQITASTAPAVGVVGTNLAFVFTITNFGPATATNVGVGGALPNGGTFVSITTSQGIATASNGNFTAILGSLVTGETATVTILVTPTAAGSLTSSAGVVATQPDAFTNNNFVAKTATVITGSSSTTAGPLVTSVVRSGTGFQPTRIAITFNTALIPQLAQLVQNYSLVTKGRNGEFGSKGSRTLQISSATYNVATNVVTLALKKRISLREAVQLTVNGTAPLGIRNTSLRLLDGNRDGQPGGNFVTVIKGTTPVTF
jgi:uncharacterized repeat protein (TIGR01451 family)